jgi:NAD(P)-dependent dehydrogenase (short-subunit alcohol dehydrogenase family)
MIHSPFDLSGKTAVVTGAAKGLGQAAAVGLAAHGADIALVGRAADRCHATAEQIGALGRHAGSYGCDIADHQAVGDLAKSVERDFGRVDILVNIAGITARVPTQDIDPATVRDLTETNYYGTFWMCQAFGRLMLAQNSGSIINMSAFGGGLVGLGRGNAAYCSTKGAIAALTRDLACEWGPRGVRVNAVAPAWFETDMVASSLLANPHLQAQIIAKLPQRRVGQPRELIGPIVFLASEASAMITGLVLPVDGGAAATSPISPHGKPLRAKDAT